MLIRPFVAEDAAALAALFHASVHGAGSCHYSLRQLTAWSPAPPDPAAFVARAADGRILLVAVDESGKPVAFGDLERDGHIDHLYCRPDAVGTGVASELYDRLERAAVERGITRLHVEASEGARRLFLRKGFTLERRRDFTVDGVALHNYLMVKAIPAEARHS